MPSALAAPRTPLPTATEPLPTFAAQPCFALLRKPLADTEEAMQVEATRRAMVELREGISRLLTPATAEEVIVHIERLALHHPPLKAMTDSEAEMWVQDWLADLAEVPADILAAACAEWRRGGSSWMPKPGQLLDLAKPILRHRRALFDRCRMLLGEREQAPLQIEREVNVPRDERVKKSFRGLADALRGVAPMKEGKAQ